MVTLSAHQQCHLFLRSIENWDVSKITTMYKLFNNKTYCNPNITNWDVSKVTNFVSQSIAHSVYSQAKQLCRESNTVLLILNILTTPIINNKLAKHILLSQRGMFDGAVAFNQDISNWDVSKGIEFVSGFMFGLM